MDASSWRIDVHMGLELLILTPITYQMPRFTKGGFVQTKDYLVKDTTTGLSLIDTITTGHKKNPQFRSNATQQYQWQ